MIQETSLQDLILGYCRQVGGLVEPPAYGLHEVLLPDDVARRWGIDAHQCFAFAEGKEAAAAVDETAALLLHYGHPLVETVVEEIRRRQASGLFFINDVRLEKPGMFAVIEKALGLPNAKLFPVKTAVERRCMYHYVRFNFKASLVADEKRELLLPVWMHLQGGYPVKGDDLERLAVWDAESNFKSLIQADALWLEKPPANPISEPMLRPLLERARLAARGALGDTLQTLEKRLQRLLELDRARLLQYYDDLKKDVERRLQKAEAERRPALEAKLAAIETERQAKLLDVEQKYHLRVDLELVNLAILAQPKLDLKVEIKKRTASTQRRVTWDALRHAIEPPVCDVCGLPGDTLHLCENGHLAHAACMAPQCIECKRAYCGDCSRHVLTCAVCERPLCEHSLVRCPVCQRSTCQAHANLCHAADGEPQRLPSASLQGAQNQSAMPPESSSAATTEAAGTRPAERKTAASKTTPAASKSTAAAKKTPSGPVGDYVEVYFGGGRPLVEAAVMVKKRQIAIRTWELEEDGINANCQCGDWHCKKNGLIYRPMPEAQIEQQIMFFIRELLNEYQVPEKKLRFYRVRAGEAQLDRKLTLTGKWKDAEALAVARAGFDKLK